MLDLETLGTDLDACVVQVGACAFDEEGKVLERFKSSVKIDDPANGRIDPRTLLWWLQQRDSTMRSVFDQTVAVPVQDSLEALTRFADAARTEQTWACDPTFDLAILRRRYAGTSLAEPSFLNFRRERSCRTVWQAMKDCRLATVKPDVLHDALADAVAQAQNVSNFLAFLREANRAHDDKILRGLAEP